MVHSWFIYSNEVVSGPFTTETIRAQLDAGQLAPTSFIWWKGQREWIPISAWESQLSQIIETAVERAQNPVWYLETGSEPIGPLTQNELIAHLKNLNSLNRVNLWAVGMEKWMSLFDMQEVMELVGLSRRENERAPLMGTVAIARSSDSPSSFVLKAASISAAGMGVTGSHDLHRGDQINVLIKSPDLPGNIHVQGEIAYVTSTGYAGIRFHKVHPETQSILFDYIKRFKATVADPKAA